MCIASMDDWQCESEVKKIRPSTFFILSQELSLAKVIENYERCILSFESNYDRIEIIRPETSQKWSKI
jgi:hypothetical protein